MKIIISPDSFKGTLSAIEVCTHIEAGIKKAMPKARIHLIDNSSVGAAKIAMKA